VTEKCIKTSWWVNIYGRQFYTTQQLLSNFRCLKL